DPGGPGTDVQPRRARMDQLLRAVLPVRVVSDSPPHQRLSGALGSAEIQAAAAPRQASAAVLGERRPTGTGAVRSLAPGAAVRLGTGSRVSREGHARFCERPGAQLPRPTHLVILWRTEGAAREALRRVEGILPGLGLM